MSMTSKNKRILIVVICVVLSLAIIGGIITGVVFEGFVLNDTSFNEELNLLDGATYTFEGKTRRSCNLAGSVSSEMTVELAASTPINTLAFYENTNTITDFEVYANGSLIYKQQEMGSFRYATFPTVTTDELKVKVVSSEGRYEVSKIEGFNISRPQNSFRVVSYLIADGINAEYDWSGLEANTDIILFGNNTFDRYGNISTNDAVVDSALSEIRTRTAGRDVNVIINFLVSVGSEPVPEEYTEWPYNLCYASSMAMDTYGEKLKNNLLDYVKAKGFDGVDFDYEYPRSDSDWSIFSKFLVDLKKNAPEGFILSAATQLYGCNLSSAAWKALDYVNVMTYDGDDKFGNHSSFSQCVADAFFFYNQHLALDRSKINLGLPFYSRPAALTPAGDQHIRFWGEYKTEVKRSIDGGQPIGYWDNYLTTSGNDVLKDDRNVTVPEGKRYFNGCQMIKDKTALCYDYGAGGVMIWNYACDLPYDNELSLYKAITDALK